MPYRVAYLGNFRPEFSTENDYRIAFENNGHRVDTYQEGDPGRLQALIEDLTSAQDPIGFILWTRTEDLAAINGRELQWKFLAEARRFGVPVIGLHLDRWWGLQRQQLIFGDPFFRVDLLLTADGAHQDQWWEAGVAHRWLPPGVSERWCKPGTFRPEYESDVAFVGGWQGGYHKEAKHRHELVNWLDTTYGDRVKFWPKRGEHAIRGEDLTDLYWSTKVVVGDSCLIPAVGGEPMHHYCSDRIPETHGRGGVLLHPFVGGITDLYKHFWWQLGDWDQLRYMIDDILMMGEWPSIEQRQARIDHTLAEHTYEQRVPQIIKILEEESIL